MLFKLTRRITAFVAILLATSPVLRAQTKLPIDPVTGKVCYKFSADFDKSYKAETIYAIAKDWFAQYPDVFIRSNVPAIAKITADDKKNDFKSAVVREFSNPNPLQFTDPESNRLSGKVIMKYTGGSNGCIRLMYLQYSLILQVKDHRLYGEISNIVYNHFNPRTYQPQPVFNWSGLMPCDQVNTLEYLKDCEACQAEFSGFYTFLNSDMNELINSFNEFIKANKGVAFNQSTN